MAEDEGTLDYRNADAVKARISELENENEALREQLRGLKRLVKLLKPGKRVDLGRIRGELGGLLGGGEQFFFS